jgi:hypothetical protein
MNIFSEWLGVFRASQLVAKAYKFGAKGESRWERRRRTRRVICAVIIGIAIAELVAITPSDAENIANNPDVTSSLAGGE